MVLRSMEFERNRVGVAVVGVPCDDPAVEVAKRRNDFPAQSLVGNHDPAGVLGRFVGMASEPSIGAIGRQLGPVRRNQVRDTGLQHQVRQKPDVLNMHHVRVELGDLRVQRSAQRLAVARELVVGQVTKCRAAARMVYQTWNVEWEIGPRVIAPAQHAPRVLPVLVRFVPIDDQTTRLLAGRAPANGKLAGLRTRFRAVERDMVGEQDSHRDQVYGGEKKGESGKPAIPRSQARTPALVNAAPPVARPARQPIQSTFSGHPAESELVLAAMAKIHIIGIGDDGLEGTTSAARQLIERADLLVGPDYTLARVPASKAERLVVGGNLDQAVERLGAYQGNRAAVLVSGDPLFYGMARYLCDKLGKERFEVVPHVSSMQLAFARVKESWEEAYLTNLASHSLDHVIEKIRTSEKVGLFTSESCPPAAVAKALLQRRIDYFSVYVCENLGSPDERVTQGDLSELASQEFSPLNVMILVRKPGVPDRPSDRIGRRVFGNSDEAFLQSKPKKGLLTPAEVRSLALAEMDLGPTSTVWDIGAGSGSVAIEAAQLASAGTTYAIEMDAEDHNLIKANAQKFAVANLVPVLGRAPEAWGNLPDPDSIFLGGSGREVGHLAELAYDRLRPHGRLVANVGSIENLAELHATLQRQVPDVKVWMINVARGTYQLERVRFDALNPTFLLAIVKPGT